MIRYNNNNIDFIKKSEEILSEIKESHIKEFFKDKRIWISFGSPVEFIDPIRVVSNTSSGKMGISLVKNALTFGSKVTIVKGLTTFTIVTFESKVKARKYPFFRN